MFWFCSKKNRSMILSLGLARVICYLHINTNTNTNTFEHDIQRAWLQRAACYNRWYLFLITLHHKMKSWNNLELLPSSIISTFLKQKKCLENDLVYWGKKLTWHGLVKGLYDACTDRWLSIDMKAWLHQISVPKQRKGDSWPNKLKCKRLKCIIYKNINYSEFFSYTVHDHC